MDRSQLEDARYSRGCLLGTETEQWMCFYKMEQGRGPLYLKNRAVDSREQQWLELGFIPDAARTLVGRLRFRS
jgi:hypothetical protein